MSEYDGEERRLSDRVLRLETLSKVATDAHVEWVERFIKHMDSEERAFKDIYNKLDDINENIHASFKERDERLNNKLADHEERDAKKFHALDKDIADIRVAIAKYVGAAVVILAVLEYVVNKVI